MVGEHILPADIFNVPIRKDILHRVVRWQLAKRQQVNFWSLLSIGTVSVVGTIVWGQC